MFFFTCRISNESLASEFVGNVVSRVDVSELSAASISLSEKGAADGTTESETFLSEKYCLLDFKELNFC